MKQSESIYWLRQVLKTDARKLRKEVDLSFKSRLITFVLIQIVAYPFLALLFWNINPLNWWLIQSITGKIILVIWIILSFPSLFNLKK